MSSLADAPDLVGFFSYSREDDEGSGGRLSKLRERIQEELRGQLGRTKRDFRLWQDKVAIADGELWEETIKKGISESVFFIPIVTPTAVKSRFCKFEFEAFLAREKELGRGNLVFPILYIPVPALAVDGWRQDPLLEIIGSRQYEQWQNLRHLDPSSTEVALRVEKFCENICKALQQPWLSQQERQDAEARQRTEEERRRQQAETKRGLDEAAAEKRRQAEKVRRLEREAQLEATKRAHPGPAKGARSITRGRAVLVGSAVAAVLILAGYWAYHWSPFQPAQQSVPEAKNETASVQPAPVGNTTDDTGPRSVRTVRIVSADSTRFKIKKNTKANGGILIEWGPAPSLSACQQLCDGACKVFSYSQSDKTCSRYEYANQFETGDYDTGVRE